ncbi:MAG: WD40 repeat domain-containing protein, partial [Gammaproteobacteria bacterium]|nr:WD40 repeat domain-containing protein [Gammaproteobacteria bacterium]
LLHTLSGHEERSNHSALSADGDALGTATNDNTARLWQVESGKLLHTLTGHENGVMHAAFSPDGQTLATASKDKTARLWQVENGKLLRTLSGHEGRVWHAAFSPDGQTLATASEDQTARLWHMFSTRELIDYANQIVPRCLSQKQRQQFFLSASKGNELVKEGEILAGEGKLEAAVAAFKEAGKSTPCSKSVPEDKAGKLVAAAFIEKGKKSARQGKIKEAVIAFNRALQADSRLKLDKPESHAQKLAQRAAQKLIRKGEELARKGKLENATAKFKEAQALDSSLTFDPETKAKRLVAIE